MAQTPDAPSLTLETIDPAVSANRRRALADQLSQDGALRSPQWREVFQTVPREAFLGDRVFLLDSPDTSRWRQVRRDDDLEHWLDLAYTDQSLVTQLDGSFGNTAGMPTSSSTMPSLVMSMLEDLDVHDGHRVLEVGTGSGYSTTILSERIGPNNVVSVDIDHAVSQRATVAIAALGYAPTLAVADGLGGHPRGAPYDRIIATCGVGRIPQAWIDQTRAGGKILTTTTGWLDGCAYLELEVGTDHAAVGRFLPGTVSFMPARSYARPHDNWFPLDSGETGQTRQAVFGMDIIGDWTTRWIAQLAAPDAVFSQSVGIDPPHFDLRSWTTHAYARLIPQQDDTWTVTQQQDGPRLWDRIEDAITAWHAAGSPPQDQFALRIDDTGSWVELPGHPDLSWQLP